MANGLPGRPTLYTEEMADYICQQVSEGRTLLSVCRDDEGVADRTTVTKWLVRMPEFSSRIAKARELGQEATVDECRDIVDAATPETVRVAQLRVWHRQWEASKRARRTLGDKVEVSHTASPIESFTEDQLRAKLAELTNANESSATDRSDPNS